MSIPRLAIQRPVTMFMISAVITLLGFISLTKLPVDLMPEFEQPQLTVRTSYTGVGPLEMEELITRPMEQAVSAVPFAGQRRATGPPARAPRQRFWAIGHGSRGSTNRARSTSAGTPAAPRSSGR